MMSAMIRMVTSSCAQFSTVSGIADMQSSLSSLVSSFQTDRMLSGSTLVGHDVLVPATSGVRGTEGTVHGAGDVPEGVRQGVVNVEDAARTLSRLPLPELPPLGKSHRQGHAQPGFPHSAWRKNVPKICLTEPLVEESGPFG